MSLTDFLQGSDLKILFSRHGRKRRINRHCCQNKQKRTFTKTFNKTFRTINGTARDKDGNIVQLHHGEDSIDSINNKFSKNFKFIAHNFDSHSTKHKPERVNETTDTKVVREARLNKEIDSNETTHTNMNHRNI